MLAAQVEGSSARKKCLPCRTTTATIRTNLRGRIPCIERRLCKYNKVKKKTLGTVYAKSNRYVSQLSRPSLHRSPRTSVCWKCLAASSAHYFLENSKGYFYTFFFFIVENTDRQTCAEHTATACAKMFLSQRYEATDTLRPPSNRREAPTI